MINQENTNTKCIFRLHKPMLEESMKTCVIVETINDLFEIINKSYPQLNNNFDIKDIVITPYGSDKRINWENTHIVKLKNIGVVGFINQPLKF